MEALDRAGLLYTVDEVERPGRHGDRAGRHRQRRRGAGRLRPRPRPGHRLVTPEPLRFLYLGRAHVGRRWYVTSIDGDVEPATFGDALAALEQLVIGVRETWGEAPLLVGEGQGGALALVLERLLPGDVASVRVRDAVLPQVPGLELPDAP